MIIQLIIAVTSISAIALTQQSNEELKKYACFPVMIGQPFWFVSSYQAEQWGIFCLCFVYSYFWCLGMYNNWIKK